MEKIKVTVSSNEDYDKILAEAEEGMNDVIVTDDFNQEEQDDEQNYLKYINFYSDMSKIENLDYFYQVIESLKKEDKIEFENGIIHIFNKNIKKM